jgi:hypothetical protein
MARTIETTIFLTSRFSMEDIHMKIIDRFLFVEAEQKYGIKGINFTTWKFKACRKLPNNIDTSLIRAIFSTNVIRVTTDPDYNLLPSETELSIDKRQARKKKAEKPTSTDDPKNYERFLEALKSIGML